MAQKQGSSPKLRRTAKGKHKYSKADGNNRSHNPKSPDVMTADKMAIHRPTNQTVGATKKARQARWERENLARLTKEAVLTNRRLIASTAAEHPSVTSLVDGSLASLYAKELIWLYGRSPVVDQNNWDPTVWAAEQALATFSDEDKLRYGALARGKTAAKTALRAAFDLFHASFALAPVESDAVEELAAVG